MALPKVISLHMIEDDIASAVCKSRRFCAIACTIYRELKTPIGRVRVSGAGASIAVDEYRHYYKVPHQAARLVRDFDLGKPVSPIPFQLRFAYRRKITPVDPARRAQINKNRREAAAVRAVLGEKAKTYTRGRYGTL